MTTNEQEIFAVEIERLQNELHEYKKKEEDHNFDLRISDLFYQLNIPAQLKGFRLIVEAIKELYNRDYYKLMIVYKDLAKKFNDTPGAVERCIRHAIEAGWLRDKEGFWILNKHLKERPINSEFLALVVNYLRLNK